MTNDRPNEKRAEEEPRHDEPTRCPICDAEVSPEHPNAPFCSGRCRLVDLGNWMKGEYVISREIKESDLDDPD